MTTWRERATEHIAEILRGENVSRMAPKEQYNIVMAEFPWGPREYSPYKIYREQAKKLTKYSPRPQKQPQVVFSCYGIICQHCDSGNCIWCYTAREQYDSVSDWSQGQILEDAGEFAILADWLEERGLEFWADSFREKVKCP